MSLYGPLQETFFFFTPTVITYATRQFSLT
jgi:hypothetical protein